MTQIWCELALIDGLPQTGVLIDIVDKRFSSIEVGVSPTAAATQLAGFTIPGLANSHSHAFHRALRSRTQADQGTFWTWRQLMYRAAARLEPDNFHQLARATFAEMALAGITCVGEFHYLHHQVGGTPYADPNAMGEALLAAASEAGIRMTLLDTLYLHGGLAVGGYATANETQTRFSDKTAEAWTERVSQLNTKDTTKIGAAVHSVRAVDPASIAILAQWADSSSAPVHAHVSEQTAENESCLAHHNKTPMAVLHDAGVLGQRFAAVHATHLTDGDIELLACSGSTVVMCPTTERDLGDGIGPTGQFAKSDVSLALGSDSHAVIDIFEEARALELDERLRSQERGVHKASELVEMATVNGHRSLGWDDAGTIAVGNRADLVTVNLASVRSAGASTALAVEAAVFSATATDITDVHVDGEHIVSNGSHRSLDVIAELDTSIKALMDD